MLGRKQQGFILYTSLIILNCIILVVMAHTQIALIFSKYLGQEKEQEEAFKHLEKTAELLLNQVLPETCVRYGLDANDLVKNLSLKQGCQYQDSVYSYNYLIEDLGEFPCLKTMMASKVYSTKHRRLTIVIWSKSPQILQVREIRATEDQTCKMFKTMFIKIGLSSWRSMPIA